MDTKNIIVVCGPTASGKTALAVKIANAFHGEIISADSRQVYRGMDIGTGKDLCEYQGDGFSVPYHLIDIRDPSEIYTLYDYKNDFFEAYEKIVARKAVPVLAGGTGLYIEAVLRDYNIPSIPEDAAFRSSLMTKEKDWLKSELERLAPDLYKKTDLCSKKRIVRALEVAQYRGTVSSGQLETKRPVLNPVLLCTRWDRAALRDRIDKRLEDRLAAGMVEEVQRLLDSGISRERFSLFGMEYKHVTQYIDNKVTYAQMVDNLKTAIHQLAKRQETWFRGMERRGMNVTWIDNACVEKALEEVAKAIE